MHAAIKAIASTAPTLAKTILLPDENDPQRVPNYPHIERTSVMAYKNVTTVSIPGTASSVNDGIMVLNCPVAPTWVSGAVTSTLVEYGTFATDLSVFNTAGGVLYYAPGSWVPNTVVLGVGALPNGLTADKIPVGALGGDAYIYIPPGMTGFLRASLPTATAVTGSMEATVRHWNGENTSVTSVVSLTATGTNAFVGTFASGLYGPFARVDSLRGGAAFTYSTASVLELSMGWYTGGTYLAPTGTVVSYFPLFALLESATSIAPWVDTRLTAASVLATNVTKVLNKEGTITAARLNVGSKPTLFAKFDESDFATAHPSLRYSGPLENGCYTFLAPTLGMVQFQDGAYDRANSTSPWPMFDLSLVEFANCVLLRDPDATTPTVMTITTVFHVEFRNASLLFPIATSSTRLEDWHAASLAVSNICPFTENWIHVPTVLAWLRKYVPMALRGMLGVPTTQVVRYVPKAKKPRGSQAPKQVKAQKKPKQQLQQIQAKKKKSGLQMYLDSKRK